MWWPEGNWQEAHNSAGATTTGTAWVMSAGEDGGSANTETYILVANTAPYAALVRATLFFDDGSTVEKTLQIPATSRSNIAVRYDFPAAAGRRFGALVESIGLGAAPLVVEQAIYGDAGGVHWQAGANALATKIR